MQSRWPWGVGAHCLSCGVLVANGSSESLPLAGGSTPAHVYAASPNECGPCSMSCLSAVQRLDPASVWDNSEGPSGSLLWGCQRPLFRWMAAHSSLCPTQMPLPLRVGPPERTPSDPPHVTLHLITWFLGCNLTEAVCTKFK